jgi:FkbM family methyltransferase
MYKPTYYGQRGDDFLLWLPFLECETTGYFVEVGALDGIRFSNTYSFEEQGWTGICVEAHPDYVEILKENRPHSKVVFAAAGDANGTATFYTNRRGSLSTLDKSQEEKFKTYGAYFTGFEPREVPMLTLAQILAEANAPQIIDILSIDVEGAEMSVLVGMDWASYSVQVIIVEVAPENEAELSAYFEKLNYHKAQNYHGNLIVCRDKAHAHLIASTPVNCFTIHTPHPLDTLQPANRIQIVDSNPVVNPPQPAKSPIPRFINHLRRLFPR